jgi:hypothetical protein
MTEEQMDLIDIHGKDVKPCIPIARKYYAAIRKRLEEGKKEAQLLKELAAAIRAADLKPLEDGLIHFKYSGGRNRRMISWRAAAGLFSLLFSPPPILFKPIIFKPIFRSYHERRKRT